MARTAQQKKFAKVAKSSMATCIRDSSSVTAYKKCMSVNMKAGLGTKRKRKAAKKRRRR